MQNNTTKYFSLIIHSERQQPEMILNSEQLPHINRTFPSSTSWLDYEAPSSHVAAGVGTTSPKNTKSKDRPMSGKSIPPLSTNLLMHSNDPHTYSPADSLYHDPSLVEDQQHHQRFERFGSINDGMLTRGVGHSYVQNTTPSNIFGSQPPQYDYPDEFTVSGGGRLNTELTASPAWYQSTPRDGIGNSDELSPYDLSPSQPGNHWSSISHNHIIEQPPTNAGLYHTVDSVGDDSTLELAQRVLYPMSSEISQPHLGGTGAENVLGNGSGNGNVRSELYNQDHRHQQNHHLPHILPVPQAHSWKEMEAQLMSSKCISVPGGSTLQQLHPMQSSQRSLSRTSIYSNNSSTSDRGSPSMIVLSNFDPVNPSTAVQVNNTAGVAGSLPSTEIFTGGLNTLVTSSSGTIGNIAAQRSLEVSVEGRRNFGNSGAKPKQGNSSISKNMDELEIVSSASPEPVSISRGGHTSSSMSETNVSLVSHGEQSPRDVDRGQNIN